MKTRFLAPVIAGLSLVAMSGCTNFPTAFSHGGNPFTQPTNYSKAQALQSGGATFKDALVKEYQDLATKEGVTWYDWFDSDFFARKALQVASSDNGLPPEDPSQWRFSADSITVFGDARTRLLNALETARSSHPVLAAKAQGRFDCWVEEQEEAWQNDEIAKCKGDFDAAMAELMAAMKKPAPVAEPAPAKAAPKVEKPKFYTVFFDFDRAEVTPVGTQVLKSLVEDWGMGSDKLVLVGHADRAGAAAYNMKLSSRRAQSVQKVLGDLGLPKKRTQASGVGESTPAVPTADGVREPRNRRVVIAVEK